MSETVYGSLPCGDKQLEHDKFTLDDDGKVAVRGLMTGELRPVGLTTGGRISFVTINDSSWTALPATPFANRNHISIQNQSEDAIKLHFDPLTVGWVGVLVVGGSERHYTITDQIIVYAKSEPGTSPLILIEELA